MQEEKEKIVFSEEVLNGSGKMVRKGGDYGTYDIVRGVRVRPTPYTYIR